MVCYNGDRMIKAIFLDFDGTVSDAHKIAYESLVRTLEEFGYGFDRKLLQGLMGEKMAEILKGLGLKIKRLEVIRRKFYKHFTQAALDGGIKLCVSVKPLEDLKKIYPLIVISNSETSFIKASIKKLGVKGLFKKVYGGEKFSEKDKLLEKLFRLAFTLFLTEYFKAFIWRGYYSRRDCVQAEVFKAIY